VDPLVTGFGTWFSIPVEGADIGPPGLMGLAYLVHSLVVIIAFVNRLQAVFLDSIDWFLGEGAFLELIWNPLAQ